MENGNKIIFGSHSYWTSPYKVGNNHYAELFAKSGYKVAYISNPISPAHFIFSKDKKELKERYSLYKSNGKYFSNGNLWSYVPLSIFTPYNATFLKSRWVAVNWYRFTMPNLIRFLRKMQWEEVSILCLDDPMFGFFLNHIKYKTSILRITDSIKYFAKESLAKAEEEEKLISRVDIVITTARELYERIKRIKSENVFYVPNGVDFDIFYNASSKLPKELNDIPEPRIIYTGLIAEWFDLELLKYSANALPEMSFVIIGSLRVNISSLKEIPNIYFLGRKKYDDIPKYLKNSQVGIIPFKKTKLIETVNPIKLYEYMACGLSVVATKWKELEIINSPAYLAKDPDDFINGLRNALQERNREKYVQFAKNNTWEERFNSLISYVGL